MPVSVLTKPLKNVKAKNIAKIPLEFLNISIENLTTNWLMPFQMRALKYFLLLFHMYVNVFSLHLSLKLHNKKYFFFLSQCLNWCEIVSINYNKSWTHSFVALSLCEYALGDKKMFMFISAHKHSLKIAYDEKKEF